MIEVNNLTGFKVDKIFLVRVARTILKSEHKAKTELSIALVDSSEIQKLNKKYRRKDCATDVLSFDYNDSGEVVICLQIIKKNAKKFGTSFKKELTKVLIHGILHILGCDHEISKKKTKKMEKKTNYYLAKIKFK